MAGAGVGASNYVWCEKESRKQKAARKRGEREAQADEEKLFRQALEESGDLSHFPLSSEIRLPIRDGCAGILIGKKGEHIRSVENRFNVNIKIQDVAGPRELEGSAQKETQQEVVISGLLPEKVHEAACEVDIVSDTMDLAPHLAGWAMGKGGKHLKFIKELSGVSVLNLHRAGDGGKQSGTGDDGELASALREVIGGTEGKPNKAHRRRPKQGDAQAIEATAVAAESVDLNPNEACWLEMKGQRYRVEDARLLFAAHLDHHQVYLEMKEAEDHLDQEIAQAQSLLGRSRGPSAKRATGGGSSAKAVEKAQGAPGLPEPARGPVGPSPSKGRGRGRGRGPPVSAN